jgi:hypothetical protein
VAWTCGHAPFDASVSYVLCAPDCNQEWEKTIGPASGQQFFRKKAERQFFADLLFFATNQNNE